MSPRSVVRLRRRSVSAVVGVALLAVALTACIPPGNGSGSAASPSVSGPISGGLGVISPANLNGFDLGQVGYQQSEYFIEGTATAYTAPAASLTSDGKWTVTPGPTAPYTTRAVVYRPADARAFNGTVIVEWMNVSGTTDANPDWTLTHNELIRDGFAWVGVSAQAVGLNATKGVDPVRYASLSHPGDSFSYDIFSQAGHAVRANSALMLGGLTPKQVIAVGESQSAARLVTYIDAVHPLVHEYDGFLVHSRGGGSAISQAPQEAIPAPVPALIRNDLDVPVFVFQTETDVNVATRQPDTDKFRMWEAAGSSHFDHYGLAIGPTDVGDGQGAVLNLAAMQNPTNAPSASFSCDVPINTGGTHWLLNAAVYWLNQWVVNGTAPPSAPPLQVASTPPTVFARDSTGNVVGGVRSPQVDAPIAALGGTGNSGAGPIGQFCRLFGTTVPFTPEQLAARYPSHDAFVQQWAQAAINGVNAGYLLKQDAYELFISAVLSDIGN
jgi:Alpha/beta hydrolase domain